MTDDDIAARLAEGGRQFAAINERLDSIVQSLEPLPQMQEDLATAKKDSVT